MNSRVIVRTALMLALALSIAACKSGNPINEPEIRLATIPTGGKLSEAQIADAIKRGGQARGWVMTDAGPGHITALLRVRDFPAGRLPRLHCRSVSAPSACKPRKPTNSDPGVAWRES